MISTTTFRPAVKTLTNRADGTDLLLSEGRFVSNNFNAASLTRTVMFSQKSSTPPKEVSDTMVLSYLLTNMALYISKWFTQPQTVTHPSITEPDVEQLR